MDKKRFFLMKTALALFMALCSVWGWAQTATITINVSNAGGTAVLGTGAYNSGAERIWSTSGVDFGGKAITANQNNTPSGSPAGTLIQAQANNGVIYNTSALPGRIVSISLNYAGTAAVSSLFGGSAGRLVNSTAANYTVTGGTQVGTTSSTGWTTADLSATNYTYFAIKKGASSSYFSSIVITYEIPASGPTITATPNSLTAFNSVEGSGPSPEKSFELSGSNLTADITAAAPTGFEISKTSGTDYVDNLSFAPTSGAVASTTVYARLKADLAPNSYSGNIVLLSTGATAVNVALSGTVAPLPVKPVITVPAPQTGTVGVAYTYQIVASENPTSYAVLTGSLPAGLTLNTTTGLISGTPTTAGTSSVSVTATNGGGTSDPATIEFNIAKGTQTATLPDINASVGAVDSTLPQNTSAGLPISYVSDNPAVATVTGNTLSIGSAGTASISAENAGNADYTAFNDTFTVTVSTAIVFTKISTISELTDGEYVLVGDGSNAMNNVITSSKLQATNVTASSNEIVNPEDAIVWIIETDNANIKTIRNKGSNTYVSGGASNTNLSLVNSVSGNGQKWGVSIVNGLFRLVNQSQINRGLIFNGTVFGQYATSNVDNATYFDLELFRKVPPPVTWNGNAWSNNNEGPDATMPAIIEGNYSGSSFDAKSLTINSGTLTVTGYVKTGKTTNNGNIVVEDGASFIQTEGATYAGSGTFTVHRNSVSPVNKYAFWSSPVENQNLYSIFTSGTPQYVMTYNTATNFYDTLTNPALGIFGKGYSIKTPGTAPTLSFSGVPHNGTHTIALSTLGDKYNLVGNPYPSNLDLSTFLSANTANIGSTLWFWDNTGGSVTTQDGSTAQNFGYATYNAAGTGTWVKAPNGSVLPTDKFAKTGHGFIVEAMGSELTFNNSMRVADQGANFNKGAANAGEGKFWLTLTTSYNAKVTQAVTYESGASNDYDAFDSKAMDLGSDAFYSFVGAEKVVIQGKAPFDTDDVVQLGNKHFENGIFKIELTQKEGLFADGQAIYLKDNLLGTEVNLQDGAYSFTSDAGDFSNRFEIAYTQRVLGTDTSVKNELSVYRQGEDFVINSPSKINSVEVYDASGRLIKSLKANGNKQTVTNLGKGVYILHIQTATENVSKKVIK